MNLTIESVGAWLKKHERTAALVACVVFVLLVVGTCPRREVHEETAAVASSNAAATEVASWARSAEEHRARAVVRDARREETRKPDGTTVVVETSTEREVETAGATSAGSGDLAAASSASAASSSRHERTERPAADRLRLHLDARWPLAGDVRSWTPEVNADATVRLAGALRVGVWARARPEEVRELARGKVAGAAGVLVALDVGR